MFKREELEIREGLVATTNLSHKDMYHENLQGVANMLRNKMKSIEKRNAKGGTITSTV